MTMIAAAPTTTAFVLCNPHNPVGRAWTADELAAVAAVCARHGARLEQTEWLGFGRTKRQGDDEESINRLFSPEFRNRLDAVVGFGNLPHQLVATGGASSRS